MSFSFKSRIKNLESENEFLRNQKVVVEQIPVLEQAMPPAQVNLNYSYIGILYCQNAIY